MCFEDMGYAKRGVPVSVLVKVRTQEMSVTSQPLSGYDGLGAGALSGQLGANFICSLSGMNRWDGADKQQRPPNGHTART
jgi:hypothetical protein